MNDDWPKLLPPFVVCVKDPFPEPKFIAATSPLES